MTPNVCVGVAEAQRALATCSPPALVFISCMKHVCFQRHRCSSPAQNVFVASDKHVHLQCDSYLEVSSRDYLVASNERIRLQCEIIFRGGKQRL